MSTCSECERLRRELDRLEVSNQTVADELGNEIGRLQRELAEARKAAFIEMAEMASFSSSPSVYAFAAMIRAKAEGQP